MTTYRIQYKEGDIWKVYMIGQFPAEFSTKDEVEKVLETAKETMVQASLWKIVDSHGEVCYF